MAVLFFEGFEAGSIPFLQNTGWVLNTGTISASPNRHLSGGRGGDYAITVTNGDTNNHISPLGAFDTTARWFTVYGFITLAGATYFTLWNDFTSHISIEVVTATGAVRIRRGYTNGTIVATSAGTITAGARLFEIECVVADAGGLVNVYVDGALVVAFAGDTQNGGSAGWNRMSFAATGSVIIDDCVVSTTQLPEDPFIFAFSPTGNMSVEGTPSVGSNWECVDEVPPNTTDYVTWTQHGEYDAYSHNGFGGLGYAPASVAAVKVVSYGTRDGNVSGLKNLLRVSGTNYLGAITGLQASTFYRGTDTVWDLNPATSAAWAFADIDSLGFGPAVNVSAEE
jgi:hypothetical protein